MRLSDSLVQALEQCKKNARQNVLLGEQPAITDNSPGSCRGRGPCRGRLRGMQRRFDMNGVFQLGAQASPDIVASSNHGHAHAKGG
jgi:hypothetical protein